MLFEYPIAEVERAFFARKRIGEIHIVASINRHIIIIDGIVDKPMVGGGLIVVGSPAQTSVGHIHQWVGHGYVDAHTVGLIRLMIFVRPPHAGAQPLVSRSY